MQFDGLLLVDKPEGMTSHDVVGEVRKRLGQKTVGHTGTLDPMATGLLVLVLGEATKLSDYLMATEKVYQLQVRFGLTTDTLDSTGQVLSQVPCRLNPENVEAAAEALQGDYDWPIPAFSAAKVDGKKLYEYARAGQTVAAPIKTMSFWGINVIHSGSEDLTVELSCSKGSFMRTWAHELGQRLGVGGVMSGLRRVRVGSWGVEDACALSSLERGNLGPAFIPLNQALPYLKTVVAAPKEMRLMVNGQIPRDMVTRLIPEQKDAIASGQSVFIKVLTPDSNLLAILSAEPGQGLKIRRVFKNHFLT